MGGGGCGRFIPKCSRCITKKIRDAIFGRTKSSGSSVGNMDSYDEDIAEANRVIMVQEALTAFRTRSENACDRLENDVLMESREYLDNLMEFLENINQKSYGGQKLDIKLDRVERDARRTEDTIHGYIKKRIQKRVSLDDDECKKILAMDKGKEKEEAMTDFLNNVLRQALHDLTGEIRKTLNTQLKNIEEQITNKIDSYKILTDDKMAQFKEIESLKDTDEESLAEKVLVLGYKCSLCELGIGVLEEA